MGEGLAELWRAMPADGVSDLDYTYCAKSGGQSVGLFGLLAF